MHKCSEFCIIKESLKGAGAFAGVLMKWEGASYHEIWICHK